MKIVKWVLFVIGYILLYGMFAGIVAGTQVFFFNKETAIFYLIIPAILYFFFGISLLLKSGLKLRAASDVGIGISAFFIFGLSQKIKNEFVLNDVFNLANLIYMAILCFLFSRNKWFNEILVNKIFPRMKTN